MVFVFQVESPSILKTAWVGMRDASLRLAPVTGTYLLGKDAFVSFKDGKYVSGSALGVLTLGSLAGDIPVVTGAGKFFKLGKELPTRGNIINRWGKLVKEGPTGEETGEIETTGRLNFDKKISPLELASVSREPLRDGAFILKDKATGQAFAIEKGGRYFDLKGNALTPKDFEKEFLKSQANAENRLQTEIEREQKASATPESKRSSGGTEGGIGAPEEFCQEECRLCQGGWEEEGYSDREEKIDVASVPPKVPYYKNVQKIKQAIKDYRNQQKIQEELSTPPAGKVDKFWNKFGYGVQYGLFATEEGGLALGHAGKVVGEGALGVALWGAAAQQGDHAPPCAGPRACPRHCGKAHPADSE